ISHPSAWVLPVVHDDRRAGPLCGRSVYGRGSPRLAGQSRFQDSRLVVAKTRAAPGSPASVRHFERLPEGRVRIASSTAKPRWNASVTIGIGEQWMEVEREEHGPAPRWFVYILRPASPGKIMRGYQEYDATSALNPSKPGVEPNWVLSRFVCLGKMSSFIT